MGRLSVAAVCLSSLAISAVVDPRASWFAEPRDAAATTQAQRPEPAPTFRVRVGVVQIDVSVLDEKRTPVRGLTAADFTVLEDGKKRDIVAFTPVELPARTGGATTGTAAWTREVAPDVATNDVSPEGRLVVIVFDWSIRFDDSTLARKIAHATVDGLGPGDQAAVVFTSEFANAGVPQNFTSDRVLLRRAIDQPMAFAVQGLDSIRPADGGFINANGQLIMDPYGYASGGCLCRKCSIDALTRVADAMRGAQGRRKVMVFIGTIFRSYEANMVAARGTQRGLPPPPGTLTTLYLPPTLGPGSCSQSLKEGRQQLIRAAGRANMTIHVVDPVGLETLMTSPLGGATNDTIVTRHADLHVPADLTGGRTVFDTNAPEAAVPAILEESQHYYLLGFASSDAGGTAFHKIEVKVNRPNVQVRSRTGYSGADEALARNATTTNASLTSMLGGVLPARDIPLSLVATPFPTPGGATGTVALTLGVQQPNAAVGSDGRGATGAAPADGRGRATATGANSMHVLVAALDPKGRLVATREQTVAVPPGVAVRYDLLSRLELPPGPYEIRVVGDATAGHRGSVFTFVTIPDFEHDALTLSGVALSASASGPTVPADYLSDLLPFVPTSRRTFARTERLSLFARVSQGGTRAEPVALHTWIEDREGRTVADDRRTLGSEVFATSRTADFGLELPLARFPPGDYMMVIDAAAGKKSQRREMRFSVQ